MVFFVNRKIFIFPEKNFFHKFWITEFWSIPSALGMQHIWYTQFCQTVDWKFFSILTGQWTRKTVKLIFVFSLRHWELTTNPLYVFSIRAGRSSWSELLISVEQLIKALVKIIAFCNLYLMYFRFTATSCKADINSPLKFSSKVLIYSNNEKIKKYAFKYILLRIITILCYYP